MKPFKFVLIAFSTRGSPPLGAIMRKPRRDYFFAPLCHEGSIYTADFELWSKTDVMPNSGLSAFCPQKQDILSALEQAKGEGWQSLMALTEHREFDSPGILSACLPLESAPDLIRETGAVDLMELGFDVVDQWTGLSALVNVGYSAGDIAALEKLRLTTNQFGLFESLEDALKFSEFATNVVPEHAPFIPLKIAHRGSQEPMGPEQMALSI